MERHRLSIEEAIDVEFLFPMLGQTRLPAALNLSPFLLLFVPAALMAASFLFIRSLRVGVNIRHLGDDSLPVLVALALYIKIGIQNGLLLLSRWTNPKIILALDVSDGPQVPPLLLAGFLPVKLVLLEEEGVCLLVDLCHFSELEVVGAGERVRVRGIGVVAFVGVVKVGVDLDDGVFVEGEAVFVLFGDAGMLHYRIITDNSTSIRIASAL